MSASSDIVTKALGFLGKLEAGQTAAPEDTTLVTNYVQGMLDDLADREVIYVGDASNFPDSHVQWLGMRLAVIVAPDFGVMQLAGQLSLTDAISLSETALRRLAAAKPAKRHADVEFF
jgi:hypothetical protein